MNNQTYNEQVITQYLLGALPDVEAERLDELSVTDDEFAAALSAGEKDLVDAYVQGELTGAALEQIESYYLASPRRREQVKFARAFQLLAETSATAQEVGVRAENTAESATKRKGAGWRSALSVFTTPRLALQWGFAAVILVLCVASVWLALENMRLQRQQVSQTPARGDVPGQREQELPKDIERQRATNAATEQELARAREGGERVEQALKQQPAREQQRSEQQRSPKQQRSSRRGGVSIASFTLAPQMRGVEQMPTVSIPAQTNRVAMRLNLEPGDHPTYRVSLLNPSGNQTLWRSSKLRAQATGDGKILSISFRTGLLRSQAYVLRATGVSGNGVSEIVGDYPFRVVKQ